MIKTLISAIVDFIHPKCPSGLLHRTTFGYTYTNKNGKEYCTHNDCCIAAEADDKTHIHTFQDVPGGYDQIHERCTGCGGQRVKGGMFHDWKKFPEEKPSDNENVIFIVKTDGEMNGYALGGWFTSHTGSFHTPGKAFNASYWKPMIKHPTT